MKFESLYGNGDLLKDKVTGLHGIVMGVAVYATGYITYALQRSNLKEDGDLFKWEWLDEVRLELVESEAVRYGSRE